MSNVVEFTELDLPRCVVASDVISATAKNYGGKFHVRLVFRGGATETFSFEGKDDRRDLYNNIVSAMKGGIAQ